MNAAGSTHDGAAGSTDIEPQRVTNVAALCRSAEGEQQCKKRVNEYRVPENSSTKASTVSSDKNPTLSAAQKLSTFKFVKSGRKRASNSSCEVATSSKRHLICTDDVQCGKDSPVSDDIMDLPDVMDVPVNDDVMDVSYSRREVPDDVIAQTLNRKDTGLPSVYASSNSGHVDIRKSMFQVPSTGIRHAATFTACTTPTFRLSSSGRPLYQSGHEDSMVVTPSWRSSPSDLAKPIRSVNRTLANRTSDLTTPTRLGYDTSLSKHRFSASNQFQLDQISSTPPNSFSNNVKAVTPRPQPTPSMGSTSTPYDRQRPCSSTPVNRPSSHSTVSSSTPLSQKLAPSIVTPLNRKPSRAGFTTPLNKQPAPLICTPSAVPNSNIVDILRTPVPLAQRKFPGPAGLLPPIVRVLYA